MSKKPTRAQVERAAKAIARMIPLDGSKWNPDFGHKFPKEYRVDECELIRAIARTALSTGDAPTAGKRDEP